MSQTSITFKSLSSLEEPPYDLLLTADPLKELVDAYLNQSEVYVARQHDEILGVIVLFPLTPDTIEIKNIAVKSQHQGKGIGRFLIEHSILIAKQKQQKQICIGTANSSTHQLKFYQNMGFVITDIKPNFFIDHYTEPIFEDGIQAKDMVLLTMFL